ncbi:MAG: DUF929 family protein [Jatrophihabitans sp.]
MSSRQNRRPATPGPRAESGTSAQKRVASERAAAARARIVHAQRRRRLFIVGGSLLAVLVVAAALIVVKLATDAGRPKSGKKASAAAPSISQQVASVPASVLNQIGAGGARVAPAPITASPLISNGKPEVLYVGAEYCPYCAAERWAVAVALSRFGSLHGLGQTTSSPSDVYPSTATLSFHGATYTSSLLTLVARELQSNQVVNGGYAPLDTLTAAEQATVSKYNAPPYVKTAGSIPFVDIGGKYVISGASYDPAVLQAKSHAQIAAALADPGSPIARAVDGTANLITAAVCATTSQQPTAVCTSTGVRAATTKLRGNR